MRATGNIDVDYDFSTVSSEPIIGVCCLHYSKCSDVWFCVVIEQRRNLVMDAKETKERMLFIHESPSGEQMSSSMEKRTFQSDNMTSTSEVRATTNGVPVWGLPQGIPPPPPPRQYHSHATANYNTGSVESQTSRNFSTSSMQQSSSSQQKSLRRHQSDSSTFVNGDNYNTTGREVATAQIRGGQTTGMSGELYT